MRTSFKAMLVAGTIAAVAAAHAKEAKAEPLVSGWYGSELEGSPTASGEPYRPDGRTAAHRSLPLGTELLVSYGGRQTLVRVNDRGPHVGGRDLDLSRGAAEEIGLTAAGADAVDARVLDGSRNRGGPAPANELVPRQEYVVQKKPAPRKGRDGVAAFLRERPYLRVLGAEFPSYSGTLARGCQEASMTAPTPTAGTRLPSVESARARIVAAADRCSPGTPGL
jgi:rare lipoprotein A (peptidoglycan hydrolase)